MWGLVILKTGNWHLDLVRYQRSLYVSSVLDLGGSLVSDSEPWCMKKNGLKYLDLYFRMGYRYTSSFRPWAKCVTFQKVGGGAKHQFLKTRGGDGKLPHHSLISVMSLYSEIIFVLDNHML